MFSEQTFLHMSGVVKSVLYASFPSIFVPYLYLVINRLLFTKPLIRRHFRNFRQLLSVSYVQMFSSDTVATV